jgi:hypothetical protein
MAAWSFRFVCLEVSATILMILVQVRRRHYFPKLGAGQDGSGGDPANLDERAIEDLTI